MLFNYALGTAMARHEKGGRANPKAVLIFGISINLALLGFYKYSDFFIENINALAGTDFSFFRLALPLAISFFTFQQIAYLFDSYKGETTEYDFLNYCLFVSFFPQLIAGPIVHHKEMMPQFARVKNVFFNWKNMAMGVFIFSIGFFKKVVVADSFAVWATAGFDGADVLTFFEAWASSLSYTLQLYYDFSGYTDMAIGSAYMFNIQLPINFNSPYKAVNIQDFWRRWHITLSRWLRDYLYIPLGGNRKGPGRTYINLFLTFLLGGLWHGAGWTFVLWGGMHGAGTALHKWWQDKGMRMPKWAAWLTTFLFVHFAWVFFRAQSFDDALKVFRGLFGLSGFVLPEGLGAAFGWLGNYGVEFGEALAGIDGGSTAASMLLLFGLIAVAAKNSLEIGACMRTNKRHLAFSLVLFTYATFKLTQVSEFLYFNF
ncbi:MAG: MBOAT family O-acyltransferase [Syntrophotaleaceae bacterium]